VDEAVIHTQDADFTLICADVLDGLRTLEDGSVHCVVTSPPYWGLRDYGTGAWDGGDPNCDHDAEVRSRAERHVGSTSFSATSEGQIMAAKAIHSRNGCPSCGAAKVDQQLGLEPTPEAYVARMVEVFREVRRVLRADGTCWINLGDSYNSRLDGSHGGWNGSSPEPQRTKNEGAKVQISAPGLKPKDLVGIPWRVAFALQADGWYLRSDIIWSKPNPMPESVTDRPTKAHEYVFLLSKSPRYFFDQEAVREPHVRLWDPAKNGKGVNFRGVLDKRNDPVTQEGHYGAIAAPNPAGRNVRSVWEIATQPYPEAHFATYPEELVRRCILAGTSERGCCPECGAPWKRETTPTDEYAKQSTRPGIHTLDREALRLYLIDRREALGISRAELDRRMGVNGASAWWEGRNYLGRFEQQVPSWDLYERLKTVLALDDRYDDAIRRVDQDSAFRFAAGRIGEAGPSGASAVPVRERRIVPERVTLGWHPGCDHDADPIPCTVLDPFLGSGTTAFVARNHGRRSIGIELSPQYADLAARRLQQQSLWAVSR
jgi:DNA modification methylase